MNELYPRTYLRSKLKMRNKFFVSFRTIVGLFLRLCNPPFFLSLEKEEEEEKKEPFNGR